MTPSGSVGIRVWQDHDMAMIQLEQPDKERLALALRAASMLGERGSRGWTGAAKEVWIIIVDN